MGISDDGGQLSHVSWLGSPGGNREPAGLIVVYQSGGWTHRTREVIELPVVPVQVAEHVYIARTCPRCQHCCVPPAQLDGVALGQQRLGVNLLSLIATLREEGRLPIRSVQWYLDTVHQLRLSVGAIVSAIHRTAQRAQPAVAAILDRIRASPVVHADETGWRQSGANGYVWTFSTPTERYFLRRGRGKAVVDEALSESFSGVLVSDCYATTIMMAPNNAAGPTCCGTSMTSAPSTPKTPHWPDGPRQSTSSMSQPKPATITSPGKGVLPNWPGSGSCWPSAALSWLTRRLSRTNCVGASSVSSRACPVLDTGTLGLRGRTGRASGQQPGRAQPAPSGHQPQGQRRHLARPRSKSSRRLPSTARFPSTLNCYAPRPYRRPTSWRQRPKPYQ